MTAPEGSEVPALTLAPPNDRKAIASSPYSLALIVDYPHIKIPFWGCSLRDSEHTAYGAETFDRPCTRSDLL